MRDFYASVYTKQERRRLVIGARAGEDGLSVRSHTVIAPRGLHGYYHVPSRRGVKDNSVAYADAAERALVMLNPWHADCEGSFMVCRRRAPTIGRPPV